MRKARKEAQLARAFESGGCSDEELKGLGVAINHREEIPEVPGIEDQAR